MAETWRWQLALVLLAATVWLIAQQLNPPVPDAAPILSEDRVDYTADGVHLVRTDENGRPIYDLFATKAWHFLHSEITEMDRPRLILYRNGVASQWDIRAEHCRLSADGTRLWLNGVVDIVRPASPREEKMVIHTRDLLVYPKTNSAETVAAVDMQTARDHVAGVGMHGTLDPQLRVYLHSQVRSVHVAP